MLNSNLFSDVISCTFRKIYSSYKTTFIVSSNTLPKNNAKKFKSNFVLSFFTNALNNAMKKKRRIFDRRSFIRAP